MTTPRLIVAGLTAALALGACSNRNSYQSGQPENVVTRIQPDPTMIDNFDALERSVVGVFTNAQQAAERDAAGNAIWMNVELHIVEIWPKALITPDTRDESPWTRWYYVEQAEAATPDKPYRQHISAVDPTRVEGTFSTRVFTFTGDAHRFAGWWKTPDAFRIHLRASDVEQREGCEVEVRKQSDGSFVGGTVGNGCPSASRGAAYATSEVVITPSEIRAWDRGFDAAGNQVWGSKSGPYIFVKK